MNETTCEKTWARSGLIEAGARVELAEAHVDARTIQRGEHVGRIVARSSDPAPALRLLLVDGSTRAAGRACAVLAPDALPEAEIEHVNTLVDACARLSVSPFDAVLLDPSWPSEDPLEALACVVQCGAGTPVVVLVSVSEIELASRCLAAGAGGWVDAAVMRGTVLRRALEQSIGHAQRAALRERMAHTDRLDAIGRVAATVAHEINNPAALVLFDQQIVTAAVRKADRALFRGDRVEVREALATIARCAHESIEAVERIAHIAGDLKGFARADDGRFVDVELADVVESALHLARSRIGNAVDVAAASPGVVVRGDPARLEQVVINLVVNAVEACASVGRNESAVVVRVLGEGDLAVLEVEDSGPGIPAALVRCLFDPFVTTKPRGRGTGLGLAICADVIRRHGGEIEVDTEMGRGTRFRVAMPRHVATTERGGPRTDVRALVPERRMRRVLLVEDEPMLADSLARLLSRHHEVVVATGGEAAITRLAESRFDVVVCDRRMPGVDGPALREHVLRHHGELADRFVFLTGSGEADHDAGAPSLRKPVRIEAVLDLIDVLTGGDAAS